MPEHASGGRGHVLVVVDKVRVNVRVVVVMVKVAVRRQLGLVKVPLLVSLAQMETARHRLRMLLGLVVVQVVRATLKPIRSLIR